MSPRNRNNHHGSHSSRSFGISTGREGGTLKVTFENKSDSTLRFYYWRSSAGKWRDSIDRDEDYFLDAGESVTVKFRERGENPYDDTVVMWAVKIERNGAVREFKIEYEPGTIWARISDGKGFGAKLSSSDSDKFEVDVTDD